MPNTGYYTTGTGISTGLGQAWTNPDNAQTQDDNAAASTVTSSSAILRCTNFDFSRLDSADSIVGISVQLLVGLSTGADSDAGLSRIRLWDGTAILGDDLISGRDNLTAAYALLTYGGPTNRWGATPLWRACKIQVSVLILCQITSPTPRLSPFDGWAWRSTLQINTQEGRVGLVRQSGDAGN